MSKTPLNPLFILSVESRLEKKDIPPSPHASGTESECIHVSAFETSKMATPPILKKTLAQFLQEYMQRRISHIESQCLQTMLLVGQKEIGTLGSAVGARK